MRRDEFEGLVQPLLDREGYELVECSISRHQKSQVFRLSIDDADDGERAITIEACARLSREISLLLDSRPLLRGAYQLEVSSAGMDRPIWKPAHFRRFAGEEVRVEIAPVGASGQAGDPHGSGNHLSGVIGPMEGEEGVWILSSKGEKRLLRWGELARARLHMDPWKKPVRRNAGPVTSSQEGDGHPGPA